MNLIIIAAIAVGSLAITAAICMQIKKNKTDKVLARHGILKHQKTLQEKRASEKANQELFR